MKPIINRRTLLIHLKGDPSGQLVMLDAFYEVVHCERRRLCHDIADWMQQYVNDLDVIKSKMTLDDEDAYMTQAMLPIYAKVRVIKGRFHRRASAYCGDLPR